MVNCIICGFVSNCDGIFFPKCERKRLKCIQRLQLDASYVTKWTRLCRRHFSKNDFPNGRLTLSAVPSVDIIFETDDKENQLVFTPIQHCKEIKYFRLFQSPVSDNNWNQSYKLSTACYPMDEKWKWLETST